MSFRIRQVAVGAIMSMVVPAAMAWTNHPIRMLVPGPAGGSMDALARLTAERISAEVGQPVVVENKPGAGGAIAIRAMLGAPPDGSTILFAYTHVLTQIPHVMSVPYDPLNDVKPVAAVAKTSLVLVASTKLPAKDLPSLINYAKANPGKLSFASPSPGTTSHYAGVILNQKAGTDVEHVPFPGSPQALTQVMGGQVTMMYDAVVSSLPLIEAGILRPYAVAAKERSELLPNVPTFAELGYPALQFKSWLGVFVSAQIKDAMVNKIHDAVYRAVSTPKAQESIKKLGFEQLPPQTVPQLSQGLRAESDRNGAIVAEFHIKP